VVHGYLRALDRAEKAIDADLSRYLQLWKYAVPAEFQARPWDFNRFGRAERFVFEPISRQEFVEVFEQVKRWGLDQFVKERNFDKLAAPTRA
jgi:hypothetical protein